MNSTIILGLNILLGLTNLLFPSYQEIFSVVTINVDGIRTHQGNIIIQVYRDQATFEHEQPEKQLTFKKMGIKDNAMTIKFEIEPGVYGLTLVDDENSNGKIDKNFIGVPKEGFGFSNFFMEKLKKPKFEQFQININTAQNILMKVKYM